MFSSTISSEMGRDSLIPSENSVQKLSSPRTSSQTSRINLPRSMNQRSPALFSVSETSVLQSPQGDSILDSLARGNMVPQFSALGDLPGEREDTIMERLLQNGYLVKARIYKGSQIGYFLARSREGDCFFIKIDNPKYQQSFPSVEFSGLDDVQLVKSLATIIPQDVKMGAIECMEYGICGAAFVCSGSICMTEPNSNSVSVTTVGEENFVFNSTRNIPAAMIGNSAMAYPVVYLSSLLSDPKGFEIKLSQLSSDLLKKTYSKIGKQQTELTSAVEKLQKKIEKLVTFAKVVREDLTLDISKVEAAFENIRDIDPTEVSSEERDLYSTILRSLAEKKDLQVKALTRLGDVYSLTETIDSLGKEIDILVNPVVDEVLSNIGQI